MCETCLPQYEATINLKPRMALDHDELAIWNSYDVPLLSSILQSTWALIPVIFSRSYSCDRVSRVLQAFHKCLILYQTSLDWFVCSSESILSFRNGWSMRFNDMRANGKRISWILGEEFESSAVGRNKLPHGWRKTQRRSISRNLLFKSEQLRRWETWSYTEHARWKYFILNVDQSSLMLSYGRFWTINMQFMEGVSKSGS